MIKANELRLNNWVADALGNVFQVQAKHFHSTEMNPIPLTAEILEKSGFTKNTDNIFDITDYSLGEVLIDEDFTLMGQKMPQMDWVHQLQNLYFALTNTELNILL